jgi:8-oxo-dGTP pyrophosphatase MutT (NUDIX family)
MALPGGRSEAQDRDLLTTAMRETHEEVGIRLEAAEYAGVIDDVVPRLRTLPPIAVRPFVFLSPIRPELTINAEVAEASWVTLDHLLHPSTHHEVRLDIAGDRRTVPAYQLENAIVWGMTERILTSLLQRLR